MLPCPSCGENTPDGIFCIRCGSPLHGEGGHVHGHPSRRRPQFAAAPHEHVRIPRIVSTLFPHLPRASMFGFRVALSLGTIAVVVLGGLRLFPVALIVAALLIPVLSVLYLLDINVYEHEPGWVLALVFAWGAATGAGLGALAISVTPSAGDLLRHGGDSALVTSGVVLPLAGLLALLLAPVALLGHRRFNDVLDGVTFGAVSAAAFGGTEAISYGLDLFRSGLRPGGDVWFWALRLLTVSVAGPVLLMSSASMICAALWLRYRAPVRDARLLGPLGSPGLATIAAMVLVVAGASGESLLPTWGWLAWLLGLDALGLSALRQAIHVGLLEEASQIPIGPEFTCPNCGVGTARHSFCGHCGISLQALPKLGHSPTSSPSHHAPAGAS